jgi:hypothetical protein
VEVVVPQEASGRERHMAGLDGRPGDERQHRSEEMIVVAVDEQNVGVWVVPERVCHSNRRVKPAKPGPEHDDSSCRRVLVFH